MVEQEQPAQQAQPEKKTPQERPPIRVSEDMLANFPALKEKVKDGQISAVEYDQFLAADPNVKFYMDARSAAKRRAPEGTPNPAGNFTAVIAAATENYRKVVRNNQGGEVDDDAKEAIADARANLTKAVKVGLKKMPEAPEGVTAEALAALIASEEESVAQQQFEELRRGAKKGGAKKGAEGGEGEDTLKPSGTPKAAAAQGGGKGRGAPPRRPAGPPVQSGDGE